MGEGRPSDRRRPRAAIPESESDPLSLAGRVDQLAKAVRARRQRSSADQVARDSRGLAEFTVTNRETCIITASAHGEDVGVEREGAESYKNAVYSSEICFDVDYPFDQSRKDTLMVLDRLAAKLDIMEIDYKIIDGGFAVHLVVRPDDVEAAKAVLQRKPISE